MEDEIVEDEDIEMELEEEFDGDINEGLTSEPY